MRSEFSKLIQADDLSGCLYNWTVCYCVRVIKLTFKSFNIKRFNRYRPSIYLVPYKWHPSPVLMAKCIIFTSHAVFHKFQLLVDGKSNFVVFKISSQIFFLSSPSNLARTLTSTKVFFFVFKSTKRFHVSGRYRGRNFRVLFKIQSNSCKSIFPQCWNPSNSNQLFGL